MNAEERTKLLNAIGQRLEREFPAWSGERIHAAATALSTCGAYELVFGGLRPTGVPGAAQAAWRACPEFVAVLGKQNAEGQTPAQRTLAELEARGIALDDSGDDGEGIPVERGPDGRLRFVGLEFGANGFHRGSGDPDDPSTAALLRRSSDGDDAA